MCTVRVWNLAVICVLIDTWWNVNPDMYGVMCAMRVVLIDTWWNVNCSA